MRKEPTEAQKAGEVRLPRWMREDVKVYKREYDRKWRELNREKLREYQRVYMNARRKADPEGSKAAYRRSWERRKEAHPEKIREWSKKANAKYNRSEKGKLVLRKRALLKRASGRISKQELEQVYGLFGGRCAYCDRRPQKLEIDHVVAVTEGGRTVLPNLVPACCECNKSKGNRRWLTWFRSRSFWNRARASFISKRLRS